MCVWGGGLIYKGACGWDSTVHTCTCNLYCICTYSSLTSKVSVHEMLTTVDSGTCQRQISVSPAFSSFSSFCVHLGARQTFYLDQPPCDAHSQDVPTRQRSKTSQEKIHQLHSVPLYGVDDPVPNLIPA